MPQTTVEELQRCHKTTMVLYMSHAEVEPAERAMQWVVESIILAFILR